MTELQTSRSGPSRLATTIDFELCADTIQACLAAETAGAARIELCSALSEGGLTPSHGLIREALARVHLPVHVLLRPRAGDFVYTEPEFAILLKDLDDARSLGVSGVVAGILDSQGRIHVERMRRLVARASPLPVTFHRAFDRTHDLPRALEDVIATGCNRLLTSGGQPAVVEGAATLRMLIEQAAGRIRIAVGGGLRLTNAAAVAQETGATSFHGSMRRDPTSPVYPADIRAMIDLLTRSEES